MKNYCYITIKNGGIYIDCPYDPDFLEVFKRHIPSAYRWWDKNLNQWWVSDEYRAQAERDCRAFFENVIEC